MEIKIDLTIPQTFNSIDRPDLQNFVENDQPFLVKKLNHLRIATFNILTSFAHQIKDNTPSDEHHFSWEYRKNLVIKMIKALDIDILALQEVSVEQYQFLKEQLNEFDMIGFAAYTGHALHEITKDEYVGEIVPILYRKERVTCIDSAVFWLSETPEKVSKAVDASRPRIVMAGAFESLIDGHKLIVGNTHYDHMGNVALLQSGLVEAQELEKFRVKNGADDIVYAGDRNCFTDKGRLGNTWYKTFKEVSGAEDTRLCGKYIGLGNTFLGFTPDPYKAIYAPELNRFEPCNTLDLLFHKGSQYKVKNTKCATGEYKIEQDGNVKFTFFGKINDPEKRQFPSDHACLMVDIKPLKPGL